MLSQLSHVLLSKRGLGRVPRRHCWWNSLASLHGCLVFLVKRLYKRMYDIRKRVGWLVGELGNLKMKNNSCKKCTFLLQEDSYLVRITRRTVMIIGLGAASSVHTCGHTFSKGTTARTHIFSSEIKMNRQFGKQENSFINIQDLYINNSNIYKN